MNTSLQRTHQKQIAFSVKSIIESSNNAQNLQKEGRLALPKRSIENNLVSSVYKAPNIYDVPEGTLGHRIASEAQ